MLQLGDEWQGWLNALIRLSGGWLGAAPREPENTRTVRLYSRHGLSSRLPKEPSWP